MHDRPMLGKASADAAVMLPFIGHEAAFRPHVLTNDRQHVGDAKAVDMEADGHRRHVQPASGPRSYARRRGAAWGRPKRPI